MAGDILDVPWWQVHAFRLHGHHLDRTAARSELATVVRDTCGIQGQIPSAAELALRARLRGLRRDDIRRALEEDRTLVRGWTVRFAVHVIRGEDFLLYTRALSPRIARTQRWMDRHGQSAQEIETIVDGITKALLDGPLTRRALAGRVASILGDHVRKNIEHSWGGLVVEAGLRGLVCFGPERGNEITFVSRDEWLPHAKDYATEEAGEILLRRYLRAFGPATRQDFQRWSAIPMPDVDAIWGRAGEDLVEVRVDGRPGWLPKEGVRDLPRGRPPRGIVSLLPSFDAYLLGHRDKGHLVDAKHYKRVYRKAGWLSPVVLVDGRVAGVWSYERKGERLAVRVEPFRKFSRTIRDGVEGEARDVARFLEARADVTFSG